ncbi:hypothetical protein L596_019258 [Steinernema carpocapsae]|uniref:Elongator complex protein 5 n=1 Tax=Steinernema carpocapsae TaxID=34508 RepID=A0A4U5MPZ6_STECR|nr:hypothetical protein L596_019258 [Steinernema carpocapsae]
MQHVSLDRSLLIREGRGTSGKLLWASFLKKAALKYTKIVVLLFNCLERDLQRDLGFAIPSGIVFVECFQEALESANLLKLVEKHATERGAVVFDSLDHLVTVLGVHKTARLLEDIKEREIPVICRTTTTEKRLDAVVDAILEVAFDVDDPQLEVCHSTCFQKNGKRVLTTETFEIDENLNLKATKFQPKTIEDLIQQAEAQNSQASVPKTSFNMGLNLKATELAAKQRVNLPYMEAQKEEGLVGINISQGKKIRAGGQIIYKPDVEDDLDDSDPDDDLMI